VTEEDIDLAVKMQLANLLEGVFTLLGEARFHEVLALQQSKSLKQAVNAGPGEKPLVNDFRNLQYSLHQLKHGITSKLVGKDASSNVFMAL
jgi:hypothetical protein